jgi:lipopolysaccharide export system permease protein
MISTLQKYFGMRFLTTLVAVLLGVFALIILLDYVEQMRRLGDDPKVSALLIREDFAVSRAADRRADFAVLRADRCDVLFSSACRGGSNWWCLGRRECRLGNSPAPAVVVALGVGIIATTIYNPIAGRPAGKGQAHGGRDFRQQRRRPAGDRERLLGQPAQRQRPVDHQRRGQPRAGRAADQGQRLRVRPKQSFPRTGRVHHGVPPIWPLAARGRTHLCAGAPPDERAFYLLATNLTPEQVRETFSTPETVPFWQLPYFIDMAERAGLTASGYRLQYQKLLARPFMLAAMVLLAAAFSLRFFRMGGVQKMILGGVASGFLLYIMSKLTDDLSKAALLPPVVAAGWPAAIGA